MRDIYHIMGETYLIIVTVMMVVMVVSYVRDTYTHNNNSKPLSIMPNRHKTAHRIYPNAGHIC